MPAPGDAPRGALRIDPTINFGHLLTALPMIIVLVGFFFITDFRLKAIEDQLTGYTNLLVNIAVQGDKIDRLREDVDRLTASKGGSTTSP